MCLLRAEPGGFSAGSRFALFATLETPLRGGNPVGIFDAAIATGGRATTPSLVPSPLRCPCVSHRPLLPLLRLLPVPRSPPAPSSAYTSYLVCDPFFLLPCSRCCRFCREMPSSWPQARTRQAEHQWKSYTLCGRVQNQLYGFRKISILVPISCSGLPPLVILVLFKRREKGQVWPQLSEDRTTRGEHPILRGRNTPMRYVFVAPGLESRRQEILCYE